MIQSLKIGIDLVPNAASHVGRGAETILAEKGKIEKDPLEDFDFRQHAVSTTFESQKNGESHAHGRTGTLKEKIPPFTIVFPLHTASRELISP